MNEDAPPSVVNPTAREPVGLTLADLAALLAGAAVLFTITSPRWFWPGPSASQGLWPRWLPWLLASGKVLTGACLVLVPGVLARRFRYGGLARPAEFLAACCGLPLLVDWVEILLIRAYALARDGVAVPGNGLTGMPVETFEAWREGPHRAFEEGGLLIGVAGAVGFFLGRRRWPGWLLTALLFLAWLGFYAAAPGLLTRAFVLTVYHASGNVPVGPLAGTLIDLATHHLPVCLMYAVPASLALDDLRRPGAPRPSWLGWTGLGLATLLFLVAEAGRHLQLYDQSRGGLGFWVGSPTRAVAVFVAACLGPPIARRLDPFWDRPVGPRYTET